MFSSAFPAVSEFCSGADALGDPMVLRHCCSPAGAHHWFVARTFEAVSPWIMAMSWGMFVGNGI